MPDQGADMNVLAKLSVNEAYIPLEPECRAMLIRSLKEILAQYESGDRASGKVVTHYIYAPVLRMAAPIGSDDCGPSPVGCDG